MNAIVKNAFKNAVATAVYVAAVASFLFYAPQSFGPAKNTVLVPIAMLLLFVFSAAFTGFLVFGRPALWYLDGKKEEALSLLVYTLLIFLVITLIALFGLIFYLTW
ncbi:MAG: hypothetical protein HYV67_02110 [Candidatus Taylorbacteria bacterium]|nr:hypothetical protein [Candidatus Taylorbacteria bacterium]